jgi:hypothetical protein
MFFFGGHFIVIGSVEQRGAQVIKIVPNWIFS